MFWGRRSGVNIITDVTMHIHLCVQHCEQSDVMHVALQNCLWRLSRRRYAHCPTEVPMAIIKQTLCTLPYRSAYGDYQGEEAKR